MRGSTNIQKSCSSSLAYRIAVAVEPVQSDISSVTRLRPMSLSRLPRVYSDAFKYWAWAASYPSARIAS